MKARLLLLVIAGLAAGIVACNGGLPTPVGFQAAVPVNPAPGIGLFLGVEPSAPIGGLAVAGAEIPNVAGTHHSVMLVAFVTSADAGDADGSMTTTDPLDLTRDVGNNPTPPADQNGTQDVFLGALVSSVGDLSGAFNLRIFDVTQNVRCITCHGQNYPGPCDPGSSHPSHNVQSTQPCLEASCVDCHTPEVTGFELDADGLPWRAPPFCNQPDCTVFDFRNRTPADLCQSIAHRFQKNGRTTQQVADAVHDHLTNDGFIRWAITSSLQPGSPPTPLGRVPIDFDTEWSVAVTDWVAGFNDDPDPAIAFNCVSLGSRRDIVAVSQVQAGGAMGDSSSRRPSITYVPNPSFQVSSPAAAPAGTVFVAYDSDATNLVPGDTNGVADVFRSTIEVWVDADFVAGVPTEGSVDLRFVAGQNLRVSVRDLTADQGSGRATEAAIGASGDRIAFVSEDTDIADPNLDGLFDDDANAVTDVYVHEISTGRTQLVSVDSAGLAPGNGASSGPVMSLGSDRAIAFESLATDLVAGDTNGQADVFYALMGATSIVGVGPPVRASVPNGGGQGVGGASSRPSIHVVDADEGDVLVAFESSMTNLVTARPPNSTTQVYLHESATNRTTLLNQKLLPLPTMGSAQGGAAPADSTGARISPDGRYVLFESLADNIDVIRPVDDNFASDVFRIDLDTLLGTGRVRPERISITRDGETADAASTAVLVGGFRLPGTSEAGGPRFGGTPILYESLASNLPSDDTNDAILVFVP